MSEDKLTIVIDGYGADELEEAIAVSVGGVVRTAVQETAVKAIDAAVKEVIDSLVVDDLKERISAELDLVIEEGWQETDSYGRACGSKLTLKDRIGQMVAQASPGSRQSVAGRLLAEAYKRELKPAVDEQARRLAGEMAAMADKVFGRTIEIAMEKSLVATVKGLVPKAGE